ncbi:MAG: dihydrolipoyl dehydrogenase family protein [Pseudomonadota bacterium]
MAREFDLVIIGSGPGGYRAAILGRQRGLTVAIVEKADWGGCCLNRGCVPKKDWHHTARQISASRHFAGRGILGGPLSGDLATAWEHQKGVVTTVRDNYTDYMKRLGIVAVNGFGRLADAHTVVVDGADGERRLDAEHVILATGSSAHVPEGVEPVAGRILTTDDLFDNPPPPGRRVGLAGSGVIGTEFAYILTRLGCEVHWFMGSRPLGGSDFSSQALRILGEALAREGVEPQVGRRLAGARADDDGVELTLSDDSRERVDWLLLGTGRQPYTDGLALAAAGVATDDQGFIRCGADLRTDQPTIFAIGDCRSPVMTANQALADATTAVDNIVTGGAKAAPERWVPWAIYSAVEMARAGMDDDAAEDEGFEPAVGFAAFETSPRALGQDDPEGHVRLLADMDEGTLLGVEVIGEAAAETIHLAALSPDPARALRQLAGGPWNHPTRAEEFGNAAETMASQWGMGEFIYDE